nr:hypothetical protein [Tanacetum cinerariifolium]
MIDYALWEVIESGASMPITKVIKGVMIEMPITTADEKAQRRLEVKARSTLMIGISNEHQLNFNTIKDAKKLLEAIASKACESVGAFGGKAFIRRYAMSMDDLYTNLKLYEPKVNGISSSSSSTQNMIFMSSLNNNTSSTNGAVNTAQAINTTYGVSTASTQINAAYSTNIDTLNDDVICSFFACEPNSLQLVHDDLEQIHPDDMEEMDLRCQIAMLTMRARRFLKKTERKLTVNGNKTIGFDVTTVNFTNFK